MLVIGLVFSIHGNGWIFGEACFSLDSREPPRSQWSKEMRPLIVTMSLPQTPVVTAWSLSLVKFRKRGYR